MSRPDLRLHAAQADSGELPDTIAFRPVHERLSDHAARFPDQPAVIVPRRRWLPPFGFRYVSVCFGELARDVERIAAGLRTLGVVPGTRVALLVPFSADFIALVFALLKIGAVQILVDPALGREPMLDCLQRARPEGWIGVPRALAAKWWYRDRFPESRFQIAVGLAPRPTLNKLRHAAGVPLAPLHIREDDPAAIIFTSGSTGPAKGVVYTQGIFSAQVDLIQRRYAIEPGGKDLACFPLFGLFNAAMGSSTVIPRIDPAHPATASARNLVRHIQDLRIERSFASPAIWNRLARYAGPRNIRLPSLRQILAAGAPVAPHIPRDLARIVPKACAFHTPYGATEALPVSSVCLTDMNMSLATRPGGRDARGDAPLAGICVGQPFEGIRWRIIAIEDGPLQDWKSLTLLRAGEVGELLVTGPQVTTRYFDDDAANLAHKVWEGERVWHRMGDVGYLDTLGRFWYCGRKSHRVETSHGTLHSIPCEMVLNRHPAIHRTALVGLGPRGEEIPYLVAEPWEEHWPWSRSAARRLREELAALAAEDPQTAGIGVDRIFLRRRLPVDVRHNAKIRREEVKDWVAVQVAYITEK